MNPLQVLLFAVMGLSAWWFWPHCARPALQAHAVNSRVYRLVLAVSIGFVAVAGVNFIVALFGVTDRLGPAWWWVTTIAGFSWVLIVGLGWPQFTLLRRWLDPD